MSIEDFKSSGILEMYVLGDLSENEIGAVEKAISENPDIKQEIHQIELALEAYAMMQAVPTEPTAKPMLLAVANFQDRMQSGEEPSNPPFLSKDSRVSDFAQWISREDMQEPDEYESMHGRIIGADENKTTLIVWLKDGAPDETHTDELEKFLILEGTCDITIGDKVHSLKAGDYLAIPLHVSHRVEVTSSMRCKIVLERTAA